MVAPRKSPQVNRRKVAQMFMPPPQTVAPPQNAERPSFLSSMFGISEAGAVGGDSGSGAPWQDILMGTGIGLLTGDNVGEGIGQGLLYSKQFADQRADREREAKRDDLYNRKLEHDIFRDQQTDAATQAEIEARNAAIDALPGLSPELKQWAKASGQIPEHVLFPKADTDAPTVKDFYEGDRVIQKQWNPQAQAWEPVGEGERWKPEGAGIQVDTNGDGVPDVTIGGAGMPKLTEGQSIGTMQFSLADQANSALGDLDTVLTSTPDFIASQFGTAGNFLKSPKYQQAEQSATVMAEQYLRALTGAAAPEPEVARVKKSILPQPGDGPEVIAQKRATRQMIIESLRIKAGPGAQVMPQVPTPQAPTQNPAAPAGAPQPGAVEDGYRFKGGNPADPNSWEKVQDVY